MVWLRMTSGRNSGGVLFNHKKLIKDVEVMYWFFIIGFGKVGNLGYLYPYLTYYKFKGSVT